MISMTQAPSPRPSSTRSARLATGAFAVLLLVQVQITGARAGQYPSLPIYPHTNKGGTAKEASNEKAINEAVVHGNAAGLYTSDSPSSVDRWYARRLSKSCTHTAVDGFAYQFTCGTQAVSITKNARQTYIVLGPKE